MNSRKVLLLTADVAGGHIATGNALQQAWLAKYPTDSFNIVDLFETIDVAPFNTSEQSYDLFTRNFTLRAINNQFFRGINTGVGYGLWQNYVLARLYEPTAQLISEIKPDLIIVNHPIVATVIDTLKHNTQTFKYAVCVVDIGTIAKSWASIHADLIISPAISSTDQLIRHGIASSKIAQELFPLRLSLKDVKQKEELLKEYKLDKTKPIIVVTGGGIGLTAVVEVLNDLSQKADYQILVVCGKQEHMRQALTQKFGQYQNIQFLGFIERMQDLYVLADVVISKGGPNTVLELLAFNKKAVLTKEIGQQEIGNIKYGISQSQSFRQLNGDVNSQVVDLLSLGESTDAPKRSLDETEQIVEKLNQLLD